MARATGRARFIMCGCRVIGLGVIIIEFGFTATTSCAGSLGASSFTVPAGGSYNLTVTGSPGLSPGSVVQGWINLTGTNGDSGNNLHFAYYAVVGP
jgi:hypothetical protein